MKTLVLSGINLFEGGPLSIYYDLLETLTKEQDFKNYKIIAFVHKKELFKKYEKIVEIIEKPKSRKNYIYRLYYEYIFFYFYSRNKKIDIWISLHDITPNVKANKRFVYCHNPSPFLKKITPTIMRYARTTVLMSFFYKYLYMINIKKNTNVIVQQNWIKKEFERIFQLENVLVARPDTKNMNILVSEKKHQVYTFIYAVFPRGFKNFEVICEACKKVNKIISSSKYQVILTINGSENKYSNMLFQKYRDVENIKWIGLQKREDLFKIYEKVDCMIFPSLLETWGLPISEFKFTKKPILLADLPYSYETIGTYDKVNFFNATDAMSLAKMMIDLLNNKEIYKGNIEKNKDYYPNWYELCKKILKGEGD